MIRLLLIAAAVFAISPDRIALIALAIPIVLLVIGVLCLIPILRKFNNAIFGLKRGVQALARRSRR